MGMQYIDAVGKIQNQTTIQNTDYRLQFKIQKQVSLSNISSFLVYAVFFTMSKIISANFGGCLKASPAGPSMTTCLLLGAFAAMTALTLSSHAMLMVPFWPVWK